jgi:hypothetical protein
MTGGVIAMFEFEETEKEMKIVTEKHYKLVKPEELSFSELAKYKSRTD